PLVCSFCWFACSCLAFSLFSFCFFWTSAWTRASAALPSAEFWKATSGWKKAIFAPAGNGAGGCGGGVVAAGAAGCAGGVAGGCAGFGWAVGGGCAGFGCAGGCANTGAALSAQASDAAMTEPFILLNPFACNGSP